MSKIRYLLVAVILILSLLLPACSPGDSLYINSLTTPLSWQGDLAVAPVPAIQGMAYHNTVNGKTFYYDGATWQTLAEPGANGANGANGAPGAAGQGYTWKGAWVSGGSYVPYDMVESGGSAFNCILATSGIVLPVLDNTHWSLVAQNGAPGPNTVTTSTTTDITGVLYGNGTNVLAATAIGSPPMIAASNATNAEKTWAVLTGGSVCDNTADDVQAQAVLTAFPSTGGKLVLSSGTFTFAATVTRAINNVTIQGQGASTIVNLNGSTGAFQVGGTGWTFRDLTLDAVPINTIYNDLYLSNVTQGGVNRSLRSLDTIPVDTYNTSLLLYLPLREMSIGTSPNLLSNAGMEAGDPPTGWSAAGAGATLSRSNTQAKTGTYSAKLIRGGTDCSVGQDITHANYVGITGTLTGWVWASAANRARLNLAGNAASGSSSYHSGGSTFEQLTATYKLPSDATDWDAYGQVNTGDTTAYFDDLVLTVPQMLDRSSFSRITHPEGCIWTPTGFSFDGTDDLITTESDFIGTSACTIMGWIKPATISGYHIIISNGKTIFQYDPGVVGLSWTFDDGSYGVTANNAIPAANIWRHIALTRTASGVSNAYIDSVLSGSANQAINAPVGGTTNVIIGNRLAGDLAFAGPIDDLQVYNRALTAQEIEQNYIRTEPYHRN